MIPRPRSRIAIALVVLALAAESHGESPSPVFTSDEVTHATEDREVVVRARLKDGRKYTLDALMLVSGPPAEVRRVMTDFAQYPKLVPYVSRAVYDEKKGTLLLDGGIWKFRLLSLLQFTENSAAKLAFRIVRGHFTGMTGWMTLEKGPTGKTWCRLHAEVEGTEWPPRIVIETGAEVVFSFTGRVLRTRVEDSVAPVPGVGPQPKKVLLE